MVDIEDIPNIPDQAERISEATIDCYGQFEELSSMAVYLTEAIQYPFEALWLDPDEPGHRESVTIRSFAETDERRGVLLAARIGQRKRRILAEQI